MIDERNAARAQAMMDHAVEVTTVLQTLAASGLEARRVGEHTFVLLPPGYRRDDITELVEKALPAPKRKSGTTQVHDLDSLLQLCTDRAQEFADAQGYLYADIGSRSITAVWNDHRQAHAPGWRDHRAIYKAEYTPEFDRWVRNNRQHMSQEAFGEFIEDNAADLADAGTLLEVAGTLQAKTDVAFRSSKRLDNGQAQLTYVENIDARAGVEGNLTVPKEFFLGLRIFKNGSGYKLRARLKYRLGQGGVKFWYELDRPERAVEDAFAGYVATVREKSGFAVLLGAAG